MNISLKLKVLLTSFVKFKIPLFSCKIPILNYIFHPRKTQEEIRSSLWKTKLQKFYLKNFGLYKEKTDFTKIKRFFGLTIYSSKKRMNIHKKSLIAGFIKIKKEDKNKKIYLLGIPIYTKKINDFYEVHRILGIIYKRTLVFEPIRTFILEQTNKNILYFERLNCLIKAQKLHADTFKNYENSLFNKDAVLVACGPSAKDYKMLKNTIHVGVNGSIYFKNLLLDFLFMQDKPVNRIDAKTMELNEDANAYIGNNCKKFYAIIPDIRLRDIRAKIERIPHRYSYLSKNISTYFLDPLYKGPFAWDLSKDLIADHGGTVFSAIQFLFYTNAKRIFLVGCDCSNGHAVKNVESCDFYREQRQSWIKILKFKQTYYPDTEIISINPVGLKGIFKDVYTEAYLRKHPEIDQKYVEILEEGAVENYV